MNFAIFIFVVRFCKSLRKRNFLEKRDTENLKNLLIDFTAETLPPPGNRVAGTKSECGRSLRLRMGSEPLWVSLPFGT